jgi:4-amino-4-deoxy-L-arabinose transferase-like glycosyltransferase
MLFHQAAGHVLGTTIKSRRGFPLYFFAIITVGLLPWTCLLGWLWRRKHWRQMSELQKDGWLMLNVWSIFTFTLFSLTHSKLPAYILPIFPALAAMLAVRYFGERDNTEPVSAPDWAWRLCALSALLLPIAFPIILRGIYHVSLPPWMTWQAPVVGVVAAGIFFAAGKWSISRRATIAVGLGICSMLAVAEEASWFETSFKANQTLKPLGVALRENYHAGDAVLCWGQLPEGLPFYSGGAISITNRAYFGAMNLSKVPFEFPGNQERLGERLLTNDEAVVRLLEATNHVLIVVPRNIPDHFRRVTAAFPMHSVAQSGQWELFSNR